MGLLYAENSVVGFWDRECIQGDLNMIIGLFCWYGLVKNIVTSKSMTCHTGKLRSGISEEAVGRQCMVRGATYCKRLVTQIPFPD